MNIEISQGPCWPVDPRFFPVSGFDQAGRPHAFAFGSGGLLVESAALGAPEDVPAPDDSGAHSLIALTKRLLSRYGAGSQAMADSLSVALAGDQVIAAGGVTARSRASFTRPADTAAYAAHDAMSDSLADPQPLVLPEVARVAGGGGILLSARLTLGSAAAAGIAFRVWLLAEAPTPVADNAPYPLGFADEAKRIGFIDFFPETEGSGSDCATAVVTGVNLPYRAAPGSRDLYAAVVVKAAYTPVSAMAVSLEVGVAND